MGGHLASVVMQVVRTSSYLHLSQPARQPASTPASQPAIQPIGHRNALSCPEASQPTSYQNPLFIQRGQGIVQMSPIFPEGYGSLFGALWTSWWRPGWFWSHFGPRLSNPFWAKKRTQNTPKKQFQKCRFSFCFQGLPGKSCRAGFQWIRSRP